MENNINQTKKNFRSKIIKEKKRFHDIWKVCVFVTQITKIQILITFKELL